MTDPALDRFDEMARAITATLWNDGVEYDEHIVTAIAAALRQQHIELKAESAKLRDSYAELDIARENAKLREALDKAIVWFEAWDVLAEDGRVPEEEMAMMLRLAALNEDKP